jgi:hypothetical protein
MSVSTEVQRTLVKSPPELWAELSDPAALARHLGELGEIKITRTESEQLVEWEAQDASGTVLIKSSGWGTKVTLKVNRALPEHAMAEPHAHASQDVEQDEQPIVTAAERFAHDPEPLLGTGLLSGTEASDADDAREEHAATELGPASAVAAVEPGPPSEPHPPADADPGTVAVAEAEPVIEATPVAEPEAMAEPAASACAEPHDAAPVDEIASEPETLCPVAENEKLAPTRPGFFARLFRRKHREQAPPVEPSATTGVTEEVPQETATVVAEAALYEHTEPLGSQPASNEPEQIEEPEPVVHSQTEESPEAAQEPDEAPATEESSPTTDIAAELGELEERTTAILVAVLDRLGAAHHRPFSRP